MPAAESTKERTETQEPLAVSVIVITKDRRADLRRALASLGDLDYPRDLLEIIVVEEGDKPESIDGVKYVFIPRKNKGWGFARNIGIRNASHDLIAFIDDDCVVERSWLKELVGPLRKDIGGVTGGVLVKDCNATGYCENVLGFPNGGLLRIHRSGKNVQRTTLISTCNCLYRKEVFDEVGYFYDAQNTRGTDFELAARATKRFTCLFVPDAVVYHKPRSSLANIFGWFVARGQSQVLIAPLLGEKKNYILWCLKNSLSGRFIFLTLLLYMTGPLRWYVLFGLIGLYYLLNLYRYAFQLKYYRRIDVLFLTPIVKLTMDLGMESGMIMTLVKKLFHKGSYYEV